MRIPRYSVDLHFVIDKNRGIGYMHISGFQETTENEVSEALDEMGDIKGLVLDLRQNPVVCSAKVSAWPTSSQEGSVDCLPPRPVFSGKSDTPRRAATVARIILWSFWLTAAPRPPPRSSPARFRITTAA